MEISSRLVTYCAVTFVSEVSAVSRVPPHMGHHLLGLTSRP